MVPGGWGASLCLHLLSRLPGEEGSSLYSLLRWLARRSSAELPPHPCKKRRLESIRYAVLVSQLTFPSKTTVQNIPLNRCISEILLKCDLKAFLFNAAQGKKLKTTESREDLCYLQSWTGTEVIHKPLWWEVNCTSTMKMNKDFNSIQFLSTSGSSEQNKIYHTEDQSYFKM